MKDSKDYRILIIAGTVTTIAAIAAFGYLAYHFDKWWIVLFSYLFAYSFRYKVEKSNESEEKQDGKE